MKRILLLAILLVTACVPSASKVTVTSQVTVTSTSAPAPTATITPTATVTPTPAPSLPADFPPEFAAKIGDAKWEIKDDGHIWVTTADGQEQDWFQMRSDNSGGYRETDWRLNELRPEKDCWQSSYSENTDQITRSVWVIVPEPNTMETVNVTVNDGSVITVTGPRVITCDKNDGNVTKSMIMPLNLKSTDGWQFDRNFTDLCLGNSGCGDGLKERIQYLVQYRLFKKASSEYPNIDHLIKIDLSQGFHMLIDRMFAGEINPWSDDLILINSFIEEAKPLGQ